MKKKLLYLILISAVVRSFAAAFTELGNDEVYYRILALFPDLGYFDHSPMVAWIIGLTTGWAETASEFMVRFSSIVIGCINTWLIYLITGKLGGSDRAAFAASLLYTGSIYASVICGTFIMPDTPLSLFWLLSLLVAVEMFRTGDWKLTVLFGITTGLAALSKYTGGELWLGVAVYILLYDHRWLKRPVLYLSALLSVAIFTPVIVWNVQNDFITFTFHGARIAGGNSFEAYLFFRELLGEFYYNNPINWIITLLAVIAFCKGGKFITKEHFRLLMCIALPMIVLFLVVSLTRETLPHWSAPAYLTLMPVAALYLERRNDGNEKVSAWGYIASGLIGITLLAGILQVNVGPVEFRDSRGPWRLGSSDFSLDMYGWKQGGEKFDSLRKVHAAEMPSDACIIQYGWDDAAHVDCYFALPYGLKTKAMGELPSVHYWKWITEKRGGLKKGDSVWLVASSRFPRRPEEIYEGYFERIYPADTLKIHRGGRHVMNFYVYRLCGLKDDIPDGICQLSE